MTAQTAEEITALIRRALIGSVRIDNGWVGLKRERTKQRYDTKKHGWRRGKMGWANEYGGWHIFHLCFRPFYDIFTEVSVASSHMIIVFLFDVQSMLSSVDGLYFNSFSDLLLVWMFPFTASCCSTCCFIVTTRCIHYSLYPILFSAFHFYDPGEHIDPGWEGKERTARVDEV